MKSRLLRALAAGTLAALAAGATAAADTYTYYVPLTGAQEVPPVATAGLGTCIVTLDDVTNMVSVSGSFAGLTSTATAAHIHGLAAPGVNAGIIIGLTETGGTSGTVSGGGAITPAQVTGMLDGLTYINVHSTMHPGGEIRGQITFQGVPSLSWEWIAALVVLGVAGGAFVLTRRPALAG